MKTYRYLPFYLIYQAKTQFKYFYSEFNKKTKYQSKINNLKKTALHNYSNLDMMEKQEREMLDRLKSTFKSVEEQENKIRSLQGFGKKTNIRQAKSIIADYINSPINSSNASPSHNAAFVSQINSNKATFKKSAEAVESKPLPHQDPENGQASK